MIIELDPLHAPVLRRIGEKLERARAFYPPGIRHRLALGRTLVPSELVELEQRYRVELPDDYRAFLVQVGNGGCVAAGDLLPIQKSFKLSEAPHLACPLNPLESYSETWEEDLGIPDSYEQGTIPIKDLGCGVTLRLIVLGPAKGRLVSLEAPTPIFDPDVNFLAWFERFLDCVLAEKPFG